jgi:hypothetical protein
MRVRKTKGGLTVHAIAGTHVVLLGLDLADKLRPGCLGFGIQRFDAAQGETLWMRGMKTFEALVPHAALGETFPSNRHPIQGFQWADYEAAPGVAYTYRVQALYATTAGLASLESRADVVVPIKTEPDAGLAQKHAVFFNRGSVATQEYARRFLNRPPADAGPAAYAWLSRGLSEAIVAFIGRAQAGWTLRAAIYELQWPAVLQAVKAAAARGADVKVLFDDTPGTSASKKNRAAIALAQIAPFCQGRANGKLMHHKFWALQHGSKPVAVMTGSTNLTENGLFGHSNLAHAVNDEAIAKAYLDDWARLAADPAVGAPYREANKAASPAPPQPWAATLTPVFSPRSGTDLDSLTWYAELASKAQGALFMTFAFGMHAKFQQVYGQDDAVLRFALMEAEGVAADLAAQRKNIAKLRARPNVVVAIGNRIQTNAFDRWLEELDQVHSSLVNIHWIHTKYALLDPLGANPMVITGSANFSKASTDTNDENMLVIRGDKHVADIYLGEFMRLYAHYAFRESVKRYLERVANGKPDDWRPQFLEPTDAWQVSYFDPNDRSARHARRRYFSAA